MRLVTFYLAILMTTFMLSATNSIAADSVYRWVDEDGNVHFSDQPPGHTESEVLNVESSNGLGSQSVTDSTTPTEPELPSRAQQQRDERAELRKENAEKQAAVEAGCAQRYQLVSQLEPSTRVMVKDIESGEVTRMDDNERLKVLGEAKDYISKNCKK